MSRTTRSPAPRGANHQRVDRRPASSRGGRRACRRRTAARGARSAGSARRPARRRAPDPRRAAARPPSASAARDRRARRRPARHVPSQPRVLRCIQPRHSRPLVEPRIAETATTTARCAGVAATHGSCRTARSAPAAAAACAPSIGTPSRRHATRCGARLPHPRSPDRAAAARRAPRAAARSAPAPRRSSRSPASRRRAARRRSETRVAFAGSSTALTKMRRVSRLVAPPARLTSGVAAATTSQAPSRSAGSNGRRSIVHVGGRGDLVGDRPARRRGRRRAGGEQLAAAWRRRPDRRRRAATRAAGQVQEER